VFTQLFVVRPANTPTIPLVFCSATPMCYGKAENLCFCQFIVLFCFVWRQPAKQSGKIFFEHPQYSLSPDLNTLNQPGCVWISRSILVDF